MIARAALAASAAALLLACSAEPDPRESDARSRLPAAARGPAQPVPCPPERTVALRLRGAGEGGPASLQARVALEAFADGEPLAVEAAAAELLVRRDQDAPLGTIRLPAGAGSIRISLALEAAGARACSAPLVFEVEPAELLRGCSGVVVLDLARSIVPREDGTRDLLPQFRVVF